MLSILRVSRSYFCDLVKKNKIFVKKINRQYRDLLIHDRASKIDEKKIAEFASQTPKQKIAYQIANKSQYDKQLKDFITKFNIEHKNRITLLDFSNYTTQLGQLKNQPLKKQDIDIIKQFQKRKIDQKINLLHDKIKSKRNNQFKKINPHSVENQIYGFRQKIQGKKKYQYIYPGEADNIRLDDDQYVRNFGPFQAGPFQIQDNFVILFLNVRMNTKVTTLNRINSVKTLLFMGNGHGIISYAKGSGKNKIQSLQRTLFFLKKNLIAIPRDPKCTFPMAITKRFQDYRLYLRPIPGFNAHGHPIIAFMLTLAGMDHCAFSVAHTAHNVYNVLKVFYKAITTNTTPQQLAQRQGFKVYRHQFIRPLTYVRTHHPIASQAGVRQYKGTINKKIRPFLG